MHYIKVYQNTRKKFWVDSHISLFSISVHCFAYFQCEVNFVIVENMSPISDIDGALTVCVIV